MKEIIGGRVGEARTTIELLKMSEMSEMSITFEEVITVLPRLNMGELAEVIERAASLLKKANKGQKVQKVQKGGVPPQLEQNHEWVRYVLEDANANGWKSYDIRSMKTNKLSGEKEVETVTMTGSVKKEELHVFADTGKEMMQGQAMSYSKILKDRNDELYQKFMESYQPVPAAKAVKKTSAEVLQEKAEKAREKEEKKEETEAETEAKARKEKPVTTAMDKHEKILRQMQEAAVKAKAAAEAIAAAEAAAEAKAKAEAEAIAAAEAEAKAEADKKEKEKPVVKSKKIVSKPVVKRPEVDPFVPIEDMTKWTWNEMVYIRSFDNHVWKYESAIGQGEWLGKYNYTLDIISKDGVEEPIFEDSDDELDA